MSVDALAKVLGKRWPAIDKADADASAQLDKVKAIVAGTQIDSSDISVVVFGSLARKEWTGGSDLDWTMLIDGEADHEHANTAHRLAMLLDQAGFRKPGATRTFGTLTFSHEIIHQIGGQDDTNRNTTKRLLLLLESVPGNRREAYDRVIKGILLRYLQNDFRPSFRLKVPRFLLNDLHRYWRTMCVDYASKYRELFGDKWAIRNVKLRMSRKLIFASGLLTCYSCDHEWIRAENPELSDKPSIDKLVEYLTKLVGRTPLNTLAEVLAKHCDHEPAAMIFDSYNDFLAKLDDDTTRQHLDKLRPDDAASDEHFQAIQALSKTFEAGLEKFFFDSKQLSSLTRSYGVF